MITEAHNIFLNLVTFTEEILNGKLHFLCSESILWVLVVKVRISTKAKLGLY